MSPVAHGRVIGGIGEPASPAGPTGHDGCPSQSEPTDPPAASGEAGDTVTDLSDLLAATLRALGVAGRPVQASRLAARAWWLLRDQWPRPAEHINGIMHFLARLPAETDDAGPDPASDTGIEDGAVTNTKGYSS